MKAVHGMAAAIAGALAVQACASSPERYFDAAVAAGYDPVPEPVSDREGYSRRILDISNHYLETGRDLNGDGRESIAEWIDADLDVLFALDMDGDGLLSWPEYAASACYMWGANGSQYASVRLRQCYREELSRFYDMDESGDRKLDRKEARPFGRVRYDRARPCLDHPLTFLNLGCLGRS